VRKIPLRHRKAYAFGRRNPIVVLYYSWPGLTLGTPVADQASRLTSDNRRSSVSAISAKRGLAEFQGDRRIVFCSGCGNSVSVGEKYCRVCGKEVAANSSAGPVLGPTAEGTIFPAQTSGKAIASLVCGLFIFAFPLSILAVIFGHLGVSEIRKSAGRLRGEGMAIAGLILGYVGLAIIPLILIFAAIAIPNLLRARMAANEASAVGGVRVLLTAEIAYSASHPEAGYTCALSDLANAGLSDASLLSGQKNGYAFELLGCGAGGDAGANDAGANDAGINKEVRVVAYPVVPQQTGTRAFCTDESGVIKFDRTGSAQDCMANGLALQ
jgi:type IV pilus assembly protein PilA